MKQNYLKSFPAKNKLNFKKIAKANFCGSSIFHYFMKPKAEETSHPTETTTTTTTIMASKNLSLSRTNLRVIDEYHNLKNVSTNCPDGLETLSPFARTSIENYFYSFDTDASDSYASISRSRYWRSSSKSFDSYNSEFNRTTVEESVPLSNKIQDVGDDVTLRMTSCEPRSGFLIEDAARRGGGGGGGPDWKCLLRPDNTSFKPELQRQSEFGSSPFYFRDNCDKRWNEDNYGSSSESQIEGLVDSKESLNSSVEGLSPQVNEHFLLVETLSNSPAAKKKLRHCSNAVDDDSSSSRGCGCDPRSSSSPRLIDPIHENETRVSETEALRQRPFLRIDLPYFRNTKRRRNQRQMCRSSLRKRKDRSSKEDESSTSRGGVLARLTEGFRNNKASSERRIPAVATKETYYRPVKMSRKLKGKRHIDAFEFYRAEDEREWARRFEELHVDTKSASAMFKLLQSKLQYSAAYPHFLSLLHHLLLLMPGDLTSPERWLLFDRILQQLVTQEGDGGDREVSVVDINVKDIVQLLASERELIENRQKIARLEADNADAITELNSREQKIYQITQDKEAVDRALQQMASQVETELKKVEELESQKSLLQMQVAQLGEQLDQITEGKQLPDGVTQIRKSILSTAASLSSGSITSTPPPPPPPPPNSSAPPPPPPPLMNGFGPPPPPPQQAFRPTKKVPKSTTQLRALNWAKLPESRLSGTVFASLDESPLYKALDLEDIDKTFDASASKKGIEGEKTMERKRTLKTTNATVLESRRQQNCAILLSKLKLSNEELMRVLLNMDVDNLLAPDMVEQLLKFTPSPEEKSMLEEHSEEISTFSRADRFLYEISKFDHYDERLRCLLYQKKFKERLAETEPKVSAVTAAAKEVSNSKRLKRILELVLALGNYMNKGPRGGAYGFKISSLNKLGDVRATSDRNLTLLHYIVKICSNQWPDLLSLHKDLPTIHLAAKVNLSELQKEINSLSEGLSYIEKEVTRHRAQGSSAPKGDRFRIAMTEFSGLATEKLSSLQTQVAEMNSQFERVARLFGEDPKSVQPEELFGHFDTFIEAFKDAQKDLENSRKKEEEEVRKKKEVEDRERRAKERKLRLTSNPNGPMSNGLGSKIQNGGSNENGPWEQENDFDDLISALRSGDVFGKDIDKMRRKKKHSVDQMNDRERASGFHKNV